MSINKADKGQCTFYSSLRDTYSFSDDVMSIVMDYIFEKSHFETCGENFHKIVDLMYGNDTRALSNELDTFLTLKNSLPNSLFEDHIIEIPKNSHLYCQFVENFKVIMNCKLKSEV
jgi:hypothetical protein